MKKKHKKPSGEGIVFLKIWEDREHICSNCKESLGDEPLAHYFAHIKSKRMYPELRLDPNNIMLLCQRCHQCLDFEGKDKFEARTVK